MFLYNAMPKVIRIDRPLPVLARRISLASQETQKEINRFDNISYDNNAYIIQLVREGESSEMKNEANRHKKTKKSTRKVTTKVNLYCDNSKKLREKIKKTTKKILSLEENDFFSSRNISTCHNNNHTVTFSNFEKTQENLFTQCDEIENKCSTLKTCYKKPLAERAMISRKFKTIERKSNRPEIDELKYDRKKLGVKPLMRLTYKNLRIMKESDYVKKVSNTLAFKANKVVTNFFTIKNKKMYFLKDYQHYSDIKSERKKHIKEMDAMLQQNIKEHTKACRIYDKYINIE